MDRIGNGTKNYNINMNHSRMHGKRNAHSAIRNMRNPGNEFSPVSSTPNSHDKEALSKELTAAETKQQTKKIMEAFLLGEIEKKKHSQGKSRREEPKRTGSAPVSESPKAVIQSRPSTSEGKQRHTVNPTIVPLIRNQSDELLQKVMQGEKPYPLHKHTASVASSDSADSTPLKDGRFHRSKSFSRAQRHSVVTELEKKVPPSRRSSADLAHSVRKQESVLHEAVGSDEYPAGSPGTHTRAISDPVSMSYDVKGKHSLESHKEKDEKKKTSFWKKLKSKNKKEGRKSKEDLKDHFTDIASADSWHQKGKQSRGSNATPGTTTQQHPVSRENSTNARLQYSTSPSPPPQKRTPSLIRRLSKRKKISKSDVPASDARKITIDGRSNSYDFDKMTGDYETDESKSNSLPLSARLAVKPPLQSQRQQRLVGHGRAMAEDKARPTATDGKYHRQTSKSRRDSAEIARPNTLNIPKKKETRFKKFMKMIRLDSTSSSSSDDEDYEEGRGSQKSSDALVRMRSADASDRRPSIQHANSDTKPESHVVRDRYQHRASKSMSDIDPSDRHCSEIAQRIRRIAEYYGHVVAQKYVGPTGRTQTPDSYRHELKHATKGTRDEVPVVRATSLNVGGRAIAGENVTHSMKAYLNLHPDHQKSRMGGNEAAETRHHHHHRITREQISHKPTGSFDSPHTTTPVYANVESWPEHAAMERARTSQAPTSRVITTTRTERTQTYGTPHHREAEPVDDVALSPPPLPAKQSKSPTRAPPPPRRSTSPTLRASRYPNGAANSALPKHLGSRLTHTEHHKQKNEVITSPNEVVYRFESVDDLDEVEADCLPIPEPGEDSERSPSPDFASAFRESAVDEEVTETTEEIHTHETIVKDGYTCDIDEVDDFTTVTSRPRAATTPTRFGVPDFDDDDLGAVGGEDAEQMDVDKLVQRIVEALCKRGDKYSIEYDKSLDDALMEKIKDLSVQKLKSVLTHLTSTISDLSVSSEFRHPELFKIAMIFKIAELLRKLSSHSILSSIMAWSQSVINPIVERIGGWGRLQAELDETERDLGSLDEPGTSGLNNHAKPRKDSDTDDELD